MKEALAAAIKAAAAKAIAAGNIKEGELPEVLLEVPPQKRVWRFCYKFCHAVCPQLKMQSPSGGAGYY